MRYYNKNQIVIAFQWDHLNPTQHLQHLYSYIDHAIPGTIYRKNPDARDFESVCCLYLYNDSDVLAGVIYSEDWIVLIDHEKFEILSDYNFLHKYQKCLPK